MGNVLASLSIKAKMGTVVLVFSVLVGAFAYTLLSEWSDSVFFSEKELYGTELYKPAFAIIKQAQLHRGNSFQVVRGNSEARLKMLTAREAFNKSMAQLLATEQKYANVIDFGDRLNAINADWTRLSQSILSLPPQQGFAEHTKLIGDIMAYIEYFSDQSNLTLDPEVESFYQMQLLSFTLPKAIEYSARLRGKVSGAIASGRANNADITALLSLKPIAMDKMNEAILATEKANVSGALDKEYQSLKDAQRVFEGQVQQVIDTGRSDLSATELFASGTQLVQAGYNAAESTVPLLQGLLNQRIDGMKSRNNQVTIVLVVAYMLALFLTFFVIRNVLVNLSRSNNLLEKIKHGQLDNVIQAQGQDEIASLMRGIGDMQSSLRETREREKAAAEEIESAAEETRRLAAESKRIADALEICDTSVMIADNDFNIVYMNKAVSRMFEKRQTEIARELPSFSALNLLGKNMDIFHKNPAHQRNMVGAMRDVYRATIELGELTFNLIATPMFDDQGKRSGTIVEWDDITEKLALEAENKRIADENRQVRIALDNSSTNTMIADTDNNIVYMNSSLKEMMQTVEPDLKKDLPNFNASNLMGSSMDSFHKNPNHQRSLVAGLTSSYSTKVNVGGRVFSLIASPVTSDDGERLGTVVEWADRTQEVQVEDEVAELVAAATVGDFSRSLSLNGKQGFFETLAKGLNQLMKVTNEGISSVAEVLSALASGDLRQRIEGDHQGLFKQLKDDTNSTAEKLQEVIGQITDASKNVSSGADEIASGNSDLSQRTEEQAASLEETASSMEQMTSAVKQTSENAQQANQLSADAVLAAENGGKVVERAVTAMSEINASSKKISDIIGVIDEIAFQTNLLALNAAVEAARAGEQGRGFAVVAGEVRNLAQRSATAAKEIKDLIRDSVGKVEAGTQLVNDSGQTLTEIVGAIEAVSKMIADINVAAKEQSASIVQINQSVSQMDEMTQQNAALVEEASAAGEAVADQARGLMDLVSFFHVDEQANVAPVMSHSAPMARSSAPAAGAGSKASSPAMMDDDDFDSWEEF